jgi:hypothetical protein
MFQHYLIITIAAVLLAPSATNIRLPGQAQLVRIAGAM